ncbi:flagellar FlbD family protein [Nevskia soli]|jgi:flagellar protein FlbD|uniref:flagellar FlbD family protein n=1 Tax=Nevskia soli TaxID=418856 RepID=UPI0015D8B964
MIAVTRLNCSAILLNSDLIETVETTPDTVICLTNGQKIVVLEHVDEILERIRRFRQSIHEHRSI